MATASAQKSEWLIIVHDVPGTALKRKELLPQHGQARKEDLEGFWVFGGALLQKPLEQGQPPAVNGSAMLAYAATREEVVERLKRDILVVESVWDVNRLDVYPFWRPARNPI